MIMEQSQSYLPVNKVCMLQDHFQCTPAVTNEVMLCWGISVVGACITEPVQLGGC